MHLDSYHVILVFASLMVMVQGALAAMVTLLEVDGDEHPDSNKAQLVKSQ